MLTIKGLNVERYNGRKADKHGNIKVGILKKHIFYIERKRKGEVDKLKVCLFNGDDELTCDNFDPEDLFASHLSYLTYEKVETFPNFQYVPIRPLTGKCSILLDYDYAEKIDKSEFDSLDDYMNGNYNSELTIFKLVNNCRICKNYKGYKPCIVCKQIRNERPCKECMKRKKGNSSAYYCENCPECGATCVSCSQHSNSASMDDKTVFYVSNYGPMGYYYPGTYHINKSLFKPTANLYLRPEEDLETD